MGLWRNKQQQRSHTTGFPIDSPLALPLLLFTTPHTHTLSALTHGPSLASHFALRSSTTEYAKPAAAAQKSKVNIASLAYCRRRRRRRPVRPPSTGSCSTHTHQYSQSCALVFGTRSCGRCSFACSFLLSGSFLAYGSVLVGWALRVALRRCSARHFGKLATGPSPIP